MLRAKRTMGSRDILPKPAFTVLVGWMRARRTLPASSGFVRPYCVPSGTGERGAVTQSIGIHGDLSTLGALVVALNQLFFDGFSDYEAEMFQQDRYFAAYTFSWDRSRPEQDESTTVLIGNENLRTERKRKSLALIVDDTEENSFIWYAPENFQDHSESDKWSSREMDKDVTWLVQRSYVQREEELERLFSDLLNEVLRELLYANSQEIHRRGRIFSREL